MAVINRARFSLIVAAIVIPTSLIAIAVTGKASNGPAEAAMGADQLMEKVLKDGNTQRYACNKWEKAEDKGTAFLAIHQFVGGKGKTVEGATTLVTDQLIQNCRKPEVQKPTTAIAIERNIQIEQVVVVAPREPRVMVSPVAVLGTDAEWFKPRSVTVRDVANIRTGPGVNYEINQKDVSGAWTAIDISPDGKWYKVALGNSGLNGWMSRSQTIGG